MIIVTQHQDYVNSVLRKLDIITATLLLTGQVTIGGVFLQTNSSFSITVGGPITGGYRLESKNKSKLGNTVIDFIDVLLAIFLITDKINVQGTYFTSGRFSVVLGGPLFRGVKTEASDAKEYARDFNKFLSATKR